MEAIKAEYLLQESHLMHLARELLWTVDDTEVGEKLNDAVLEVGGSGWVFQAFQRTCGDSQDASSTYRIFTNAFEWMQQYNRQNWYLIDHSLRYAESNDAPKQLSTIPVQTHGQRRLLLAAREKGLGDGFVFPAHCAEKNRVGALQVFWPNSDSINKDRVSALSMAMRTVATAALQRVVAIERDDLFARVGLTERDITLLKYGADGYSSREIADLEGRNKRTVDKEFQRASRKLGVKRRSSAVETAQRIGLI